MSQLKPKQLKLAAAGDLLIGGTSGTGTTISATGNGDKILRVVNGAPAWSVNDHLVSPNGFNSATMIDAKGMVVAVQNAAGTAPVTLATFKSGSASDENFVFSSTQNTLSIAAQGTASDIDVVIAPKGNGDVIIGNAGGGIIQADDGEDLAIKGGDGLGNLFLNGGGSGKIYYADDATNALKEIATVGNVAAAVRTQTRNEFDGSQAAFILASKTIGDSIIAHVNGLVVKSNQYTYNSANQTVTFSNLPYALDSNDQVVFTYEVAA